MWSIFTNGRKERVSSASTSSSSRSSRRKINTDSARQRAESDTKKPSSQTTKDRKNSTGRPRSSSERVGSVFDRGDVAHDQRNNSHSETVQSTRGGFAVNERGRGQEDTRIPPTSRPELSPSIPNQFPDQAPQFWSLPYRPPGSPAHGEPSSFGAAADFYGDQGQSVHSQPGIRPGTPIIVGTEPHLMAALPTPNPPQETGNGSAAEFYGEAISTATAENSSSNFTEGHASIANANLQAPETRPPIKPGKQNHANMTNTPLAVIGAAGASAVAATAIAHSYHASHNSSDVLHSSPAGKLNTKPLDHDSYHTTNVDSVATLNSQGVSTYNDNDNEYEHEHEHQRHGPVGRFVDWWNDHEDVRKMEEYTEYIGVCRHCFDPHSSAWDAPRRHYPSRKRGSHFGRIDKERRYARSSSSLSSNSDRFDAGMTTAGLTGAAYSSAKSNRHRRRSNESIPDSDYGMQLSDREQHRRRFETRRRAHGDDLIDQAHRFDERPQPGKANAERNSSIRTDLGATLAGGAMGATGLYLANNSHIAPSLNSHQHRISSPDRQTSKSRHRRGSTSSSDQNVGFFGRLFSSSSRTTKKKARNPREATDNGPLVGSRKHNNVSPANKKKRQKRDSTPMTAVEAVAGLGTAAALLSAVEAGRDRQHRRQPEIFAVRDQRQSTGPAKIERYPRQPYNYHSSSTDNAWEDASDSGVASSIDSGLAFGHNEQARRSTSSLESDASISEKWNWRWDRSGRRRKFAPKLEESHTFEPSPSPKSPDRRRQTNAQKITSKPGDQDVRPPLQALDPIPIEEPTSSGRTAQIRSSDLPLRQPQPVIPRRAPYFDTDFLEKVKDSENRRIEPIVTPTPEQLSDLKGPGWNSSLGGTSIHGHADEVDDKRKRRPSNATRHESSTEDAEVSQGNMLSNEHDRKSILPDLIAGGTSIGIVGTIAAENMQHGRSTSKDEKGVRKHTSLERRQDTDGIEADGSSRIGAEPDFSTVYKNVQRNTNTTADAGPTRSKIQRSSSYPRNDSPQTSQMPAEAEQSDSDETNLKRVQSAPVYHQVREVKRKETSSEFHDDVFDPNFFNRSDPQPSEFTAVQRKDTSSKFDDDVFDPDYFNRSDAKSADSSLQNIVTDTTENSGMQNQKTLVGVDGVELDHLEPQPAGIYYPNSDNKWLSVFHGSVPLINLIQPTPPESYAGSAKDPNSRSPSPLNNVRDSALSNGEPQPVGRERKNRVSWGEPETHVYEVETPESTRDEYFSPSRDEESKAKEASFTSASRNDEGVANIPVAKIPDDAERHLPTIERGKQEVQTLPEDQTQHGMRDPPSSEQDSAMNSSVALEDATLEQFSAMPGAFVDEYTTRTDDEKLESRTAYENVAQSRYDESEASGLDGQDTSLQSGTPDVVKPKESNHEVQGYETMLPEVGFPSPPDAIAREAALEYVQVDDEKPEPRMVNDLDDSGRESMEKRAGSESSEGKSRNRKKSGRRRSSSEVKEETRGNKDHQVSDDGENSSGSSKMSRKKVKASSPPRSKGKKVGFFSLLKRSLSEDQQRLGRSVSEDTTLATNSSSKENQKKKKKKPKRHSTPNLLSDSDFTMSSEIAEDGKAQEIERFQGEESDETLRSGALARRSTTDAVFSLDDEGSGRESQFPKEQIMLPPGVPSVKDLDLSIKDSPDDISALVPQRDLSPVETETPDNAKETLAESLLALETSSTFVPSAQHVETEEKFSLPVSYDAVPEMVRLPDSRPDSPYDANIDSSTPGLTGSPQSALASMTNDLISKTAIPLRFRPPPISPTAARESAQSTPRQSMSATTLQQSPLARSKASRPSSLEFKTSNEFRPLYLLETNFKSPQPDLEGALPSLPSSRTSSVLDADERSEYAGSSMHGSPPSRYDLDDSHWASASPQEMFAPGYLDSQQSTPKAYASHLHLSNVPSFDIESQIDASNSESRTSADPLSTVTETDGFSIVPDSVLSAEVNEPGSDEKSKDESHMPRTLVTDGTEPMNWAEQSQNRTGSEHATEIDTDAAVTATTHVTSETKAKSVDSDTEQDQVGALQFENKAEITGVGRNKESMFKEQKSGLVDVSTSLALLSADGLLLKRSSGAHTDTETGHTARNVSVPVETTTLSASISQETTRAVDAADELESSQVFGDILVSDPASIPLPPDLDDDLIEDSEKDDDIPFHEAFEQPFIEGWEPTDAENGREDREPISYGPPPSPPANGGDESMVTNYGVRSPNVDQDDPRYLIDLSALPALPDGDDKDLGSPVEFEEPLDRASQTVEECRQASEAAFPLSDLPTLPDTDYNAPGDHHRQVSMHQSELSAGRSGMTRSTPMSSAEGKQHSASDSAQEVPGVLRAIESDNIELSTLPYLPDGDDEDLRSPEEDIDLVPEHQSQDLELPVIPSPNLDPAQSPVNLGEATRDPKAVAKNELGTQDYQIGKFPVRTYSSPDLPPLPDDEDEDLHDLSGLAIMESDEKLSIGKENITKTSEISQSWSTTHHIDSESLNESVQISQMDPAVDREISKDDVNLFSESFSPPDSMDDKPDDLSIHQSSGERFIPVDYEKHNSESDTEPYAQDLETQERPPSRDLSLLGEAEDNASIDGVAGLRPDPSEITIEANEIVRMIDSIEIEPSDDVPVIREHFQEDPNREETLDDAVVFATDEVPIEPALEDDENGNQAFSWVEKGKKKGKKNRKSRQNIIEATAEMETVVKSIENGGANRSTLQPPDSKTQQDDDWDRLPQTKKSKKGKKGKSFSTVKKSPTGVDTVAPQELPASIGEDVKELTEQETSTDAPWPSTSGSVSNVGTAYNIKAIHDTVDSDSNSPSNRTADTDPTTQQSNDRSSHVTESIEEDTRSLSDTREVMCETNQNISAPHELSSILVDPSSPAEKWPEHPRGGPNDRGQGPRELLGVLIESPKLPKDLIEKALVEPNDSALSGTTTENSNIVEESQAVTADFEEEALSKDRGLADANEAQAANFSQARVTRGSQKKAKKGKSKTQSWEAGLPTDDGLNTDDAEQNRLEEKRLEPSEDDHSTRPMITTEKRDISFDETNVEDLESSEWSMKPKSKSSKKKGKRAKKSLPDEIKDDPVNNFATTTTVPAVQIPILLDVEPEILGIEPLKSSQDKVDGSMPDCGLEKETQNNAILDIDPEIKDDKHEEDLEPVLDWEPSKILVDAEPLVDATPLAGAGLLADAGSVADAELPVEAEPLADTKSLADAGSPVDAKPLTDAKPLVDTESLAKTESPADIESLAEARPMADTRSLVDAETLAGAEPPADATISAETQQTATVEYLVDTESMIGTEAIADEGHGFTTDFDQDRDLGENKLELQARKEPTEEASITHTADQDRDLRETETEVQAREEPTEEASITNTANSAQHSDETRIKEEFDPQYNFMVGAKKTKKEKRKSKKASMALKTNQLDMGVLATREERLTLPRGPGRHEHAGESSTPDLRADNDLGENSTPQTQPLIRSTEKVYPNTPSKIRGNSPTQQWASSVSPEDASQAEDLKTSHGKQEEDFDFAATLAAGLQETGFDPDLVINDSSYHRRDSPKSSSRMSNTTSEHGNTTPKRESQIPGTVPTWSFDVLNDMENGTREGFTENKENRSETTKRETFDDFVSFGLESAGFDRQKIFENSHSGEAPLSELKTLELLPSTGARDVDVERDLRDLPGAHVPIVATEYPETSDSRSDNLEIEHAEEGRLSRGLAGEKSGTDLDIGSTPGDQNPADRVMRVGGDSSDELDLHSIRHDSFPTTPVRNVSSDKDWDSSSKISATRESPQSVSVEPMSKERTSALFRTPPEQQTAENGSRSHLVEVSPSIERATQREDATRGGTLYGSALGAIPMESRATSQKNELSTIVEHGSDRTGDEMSQPTPDAEENGSDTSVLVGGSSSYRWPENRELEASGLFPTIASPTISETANTHRRQTRSTSVASSTIDHGRPASAVSMRSRTPGSVVSQKSAQSLHRSNPSSDLGVEYKRGLAQSPLGDKRRDFQTTTPRLQNYDPLRGSGKDRRQDMSDQGVYEGWGDIHESPRSPSRPQSVRRRQSSQIIDLEIRLDQLAAENRDLRQGRGEGVREAAPEVAGALRARDERLREKDVEINSMRANLKMLQEELSRLSEQNAQSREPKSAQRQVSDDCQDQILAERDHAHREWQASSRELDALRQEHDSLTTGMKAAIDKEVANALAEKNTQINSLRNELEDATRKIQSLQQQILMSTDFLNTRDEDYFESACQQLCQHVQQWVLRFSKFSDMRVCRSLAEIRDENIETRLDNAILDGTDVDIYLADRVRRRDVFMSVVTTLIWEFIFTRYLFGMDREQRQKLKNLEKTLLEVGPQRAVAQWRATTLTLLSRRPTFSGQREQDTEAVVHEIYRTLSTILPPPHNLIGQIQESLRNLMRLAVDLSIDMRTQRAEYMMLPPLRPEYDSNGDLVKKVYFNAGLMNERSGDFESNEGLEREHAIVRLVLFPLVVKKGDDDGEGNVEVVIAPAQVHVSHDSDKRSANRGRIMSGGGAMNKSTTSIFAPSTVGQVNDPENVV